MRRIRPAPASSATWLANSQEESELGQRAISNSRTIIQAKEILDEYGSEEALRFLVESELHRLLSPEIQVLSDMLGYTQSDSDEGNRCKNCRHAATCKHYKEG